MSLIPVYHNTAAESLNALTFNRVPLAHFLGGIFGQFIAFLTKRGGSPFLKTYFYKYTKVAKSTWLNFYRVAAFSVFRLKQYFTLNVEVIKTKRTPPKIIRIRQKLVQLQARNKYRKAFRNFLIGVSHRREFGLDRRVFNEFFDVFLAVQTHSTLRKAMEYVVLSSDIQLRYAGRFIVRRPKGVSEAQQSSDDVAHQQASYLSVFLNRIYRGGPNKGSTKLRTSFRSMHHRKTDLALNMQAFNIKRYRRIRAGDLVEPLYTNICGGFFNQPDYRWSLFNQLFKKNLLAKYLRIVFTKKTNTHLPQAKRKRLSKTRRSFYRKLGFFQEWLNRTTAAVSGTVDPFFCGHSLKYRVYGTNLQLRSGKKGQRYLFKAVGYSTGLFSSSVSIDQQRVRFLARIFKFFFLRRLDRRWKGRFNKQYGGRLTYFRVLLNTMSAKWIYRALPRSFGQTHVQTPEFSAQQAFRGLHVFSQRKRVPALAAAVLKRKWLRAENRVLRDQIDDSLYQPLLDPKEYYVMEGETWPDALRRFVRLTKRELVLRRRRLYRSKLWLFRRILGHGPETR